MTATEITLLAAVIAAISAIIGVSIGSIISLKISKIQFKAQVLSANRQQWINTLRDTVAEFHSTVAMIHSELYNPVKGQETYREFMKKIERATYLRAKASLLINPNETDHKEMIDMVEKILTMSLKDIIDKNFENSNEIGNAQVALIKVVQRVLKREWIRVKIGD